MIIYTSDYYHYSSCGKWLYETSQDDMKLSNLHACVHFYGMIDSDNISKFAFVEMKDESLPLLFTDDGVFCIRKGSVEKYTGSVDLVDQSKITYYDSFEKLSEAYLQEVEK